MEEIYDCIIIGASAAGTAAAIYASRRAMKTIIISKNVGGQIVTTNLIENYPGFIEISGPELAMKFDEHVRHFGIETVFEEVTEIKPKEKNYILKTENKEYEGKTVILAFGKTPRSLNVPGEKKFGGKGISYCTTCDLPLFAGKNVAVVGGGNSAIDGAIYGSEIAAKVYLIHRRDKFRGFETHVEELKKKKNVEFLLNSVVTEFKGDDVLRKAVVENMITKERREIDIDGCFIEIGSEINRDLIKNLVKLDEYNQIKITQNQETFYPDNNEIRPGIFAAGDLTEVPFKQIVVSGGEGCKAALQAYNYLHGLQPLFVADWTVKRKE